MQISAPLIIAIVSFCVGTCCAILSTIYTYIMIGELNRKRPDGNLISYFGFALPKTIQIFREYRRSYPEGRLHIYTWITMALSFIAMFSVFVCLHLIPRSG